MSVELCLLLTYIQSNFRVITQKQKAIIAATVHTQEVDVYWNLFCSHTDCFYISHYSHFPSPLHTLTLSPYRCHPTHYNYRHTCLCVVVIGQFIRLLRVWRSASNCSNRRQGLLLLQVQLFVSCKTTTGMVSRVMC